MWRFDSETDPGRWVPVDSPTNVTLRDLTTSTNGPVAVGTQGVVLGRGRERWGVVLDDGPGAKGNTLHAVDSTDDGDRVWFAGGNGALGYYDLKDDDRTDLSKPRGNSNTFTALAVTGERGSEKFLVGDGSGNILPGDMTQGEADWGWSACPNGGNAIESLAHDDDGYGYAIDADSNVFMTTEEDGWARIGVDDAQNSFYDCSLADGVFLTGGGNGVAYETEDLGDHDTEATWTPYDLGGFTVYGLDAGKGGQLACGEGGNILVRVGDGDWEAGRYAGNKTLRAVLVDDPMVAVGSNGLILERREDDGNTENSSDGDDNDSDPDGDDNDSDPDGNAGSTDQQNATGDATAAPADRQNDPEDAPDEDEDDPDDDDVDDPDPPDKDG